MLLVWLKIAMISLNLVCMHLTANFCVYIDGACAGLPSTVVWLSQINRQQQSDGIE